MIETKSEKRAETIKFLYSYGGKIAPRHSDGALRYVGGHTRVLTVDRSISFSELMLKFGECYGNSVNLKCKLPNEDLDVLVSIKSDEDLSNLMEEYDRLAAVKKNRDFKIRAVLFPVESLKKISPPPSIDSRSSPTSPILGSDYRYVHRFSPPPTARRSFSGNCCCHTCCGGTGRERQRQQELYFVPSWIH
ncbi:PB1 domain [Dillenia turbinata]|uniref:PB1 domain n=1 Tax=Dillenia turbinata TaxID=194707 RepID=A0AAN8Z4T0_9MAGN